MGSRKTDQIVSDLLRLAWYAGSRATRLVASGLARGIVHHLPPPSSKINATTVGLAVGAGVDLVATAVGALTGSPNGLGVGAVVGTGLGGLVGWAVAEAGMAEAAAQHGAIALGQRSGTLGVPTTHVMPRAARLRHVAVYGATGSGKSTVLRNLAFQDAAAPGKPGLLCLDIKDDLATAIAAHVPPARVNDVILFDPADTDFPPAFNPFAGVPAAQRTLAAAELVAAFKRLFAESWGPRLEHVLRAVLLTLLETPDATLLDVARILTDDRYRAWAVSHLTNFSVQQFWQHEFPAIIGKGSVANVASLLNKLGVFSYPEIRNVVGQTARGLDLRQAMDQGAIVLANLPQGVLGEDASSFLAALLVGKAQLAAQSRVTLPHDQRRPFYLFADEFQNYETSAFTKLITEGRSMGVGVVAACQFREQLAPALRLALDHNCAYALHCRSSSGKHQVVAQKLQEPQAPDAVVLLRALPPPQGGATSQLSTIRARSRQLLAQPRAAVEAAIAQRMTTTGATPPAGPTSGAARPGAAAGQTLPAPPRTRRVTRI